MEKTHLNENKFTLYKLCAVRWRVSSIVEGIQYRRGISSVSWRISSTDVSHHQYGGAPSSVWWRVFRYAVWTCHIINTEESVQYRTTKTAQGVPGGCTHLRKMIFYRQSYYNPHFIPLWLNPDVGILIDHTGITFSIKKIVCEL